MPRVERVVADHSQSLIRKKRLILEDMVQVLIMSPRQHDIVHTTARLIDAIRGVVLRVVVIRVPLHGLRVNDLVAEGTADGEGIAHDIPLAGSTIEEEKLAEIVDQTGDLHPAGLAVSAHGFG